MDVIKYDVPHGFLNEVGLALFVDQCWRREGSIRITCMTQLFWQRYESCDYCLSQLARQRHTEYLYD